MTSLDDPVAVGTLAKAMTTGAALFDEIAAFIRRYVVMSETQLVAVALWVVHTHVIDAARTTPYLSITSAEPESGKTRVLEVLERLVANDWLTGRVGAAALARRVASSPPPTLLLDESDAMFGGGQEYAEALRGILNTGYRRGGKTTICVRQGGDWGVVDLPTFGPKAIARLEKLPDTVASRSIPIRLKKRAPNEPVEDFYWDEAEADAAPQRQRLERFASENEDALKEARPDLPPGLRDRTAECWRPLFAVADRAGGAWPQRAREAAIDLSMGGSREETSQGVRLLSALRDVFTEAAAERLKTIEVIRALAAAEVAEWGDWWDADKDKPARNGPQKLARILKRHGIQPRTIRFDDGTAKGYDREWFEDAWSRHLPPVALQAAALAVTPVTLATQAGLSAHPTRNTDGAVTAGAGAANPHGDGDVTAVTAKCPPVGLGAPLGREDGAAEREAALLEEIEEALADGTLVEIVGGAGTRDQHGTPAPPPHTPTQSGTPVQPAIQAGLAADPSRYSDPRVPHGRTTANPHDKGGVPGVPGERRTEGLGVPEEPGWSDFPAFMRAAFVAGILTFRESRHRQRLHQFVLRGTEAA